MTSLRFDGRRNSANVGASGALEHCNLRNRTGSSRRPSNAEDRKCSMSNARWKHNGFVRAYRPVRASMLCLGGTPHRPTRRHSGAKRALLRLASAQSVASFLALHRHRPIAVAGNSTSRRMRAFGFAWSSSNRGTQGPRKNGCRRGRLQARSLAQRAASNRDGFTPLFSLSVNRLRAVRVRRESARLLHRSNVQRAAQVGSRFMLGARAG